MGRTLDKLDTTLQAEEKKENMDVGSVKVGATVKLSANVVYYEGKSVPDWVKRETWIVKSVSGDRVVLGKNVSGTHEINSPVNIKHIVSGVSEVVLPQMEQKAAPVGTVVAPKGEMKVSDKGVELVAKYEGCRLEAYKCPAGVWTIGYGHTAGVKQGDKLASKEIAKNMLKLDLEKYGNYVNACVKKGLITFSLNQNQFDALTSFCYNCGNGSLQKLVAGRDAATIADKMLQYNKGGGKVLPGLVRRREEEKILFLS